MPNMEVPSARSESKTHIFELRTYESNNQRSLARKIRMSTRVRSQFSVRSE